MKTPVHFAAPYLMAPTNPITVNLIGAGGTGSHMISALARINSTLKIYDHPGLQVNLWDDDEVTLANQDRQYFAKSEIGLNKAVARIAHTNRHAGTNWKAITEKFTRPNVYGQQHCANIYISCIDKVKPRFEISDMLQELSKEEIAEPIRPYYWMDFGNAQVTGQALLATVGNIPQPKSKIYLTRPFLPSVVDQFRHLLLAQPEDDQPSCSQREALEKQDLFINSALVQNGGSLLLQLLRNGMIEKRGFFVNIEDLCCQPIRLT
ncbi:PRTRC system ThiF family protein [Pedobacter frigoris]|uniref:PRTRC system ThiF family protein n=1 Tax=Pedobacter frigoris TaxID=2571272 RepID=UPI00292DE488|nr:PRTRC system ThiF family protein [Pedobacter frigoris]